MILYMVVCNLDGELIKSVVFAESTDAAIDMVKELDFASDASDEDFSVDYYEDAGVIACFQDGDLQ